MKWSDLGDIIAKAAPILGTAIGGPAGGAIGAGVAALFGVENEPKEIAEAIARDPDAFAKLREYEMRHKERLEQMNLDFAQEQIRQVNETMRKEAASEHWLQYAWRPIWGLVAAGAFVLVVILIFVIVMGAFLSDDANAFQVFSHIPLIISAFAGLFSIPLVILGVASHHRGKEKRIRAGEMVPDTGAFQSIAQSVRGLVKGK